VEVVVFVEDEIVRLRERVTLLEQQIAALLGNSTVPVTNEAPQAPEIPMWKQRLLASLQQGNELQAIKEYRDAHQGASLSEARDAVNAMRVEL
jgi:ribosomal protein L7/L12